MHHGLIQCFILSFLSQDHHLFTLSNVVTDLQSASLCFPISFFLKQKHLYNVTMTLRQLISMVTALKQDLLLIPSFEGHIWRVVTPQCSDEAVPIQRLFHLRPSNTSFYSSEIMAAIDVCFKASVFNACQTILVETMPASADESTLFTFKFKYHI